MINPTCATNLFRNVTADEEDYDSSIRGGANPRLPSLHECGKLITPAQKHNYTSEMFRLSWAN